MNNIAFEIGKIKIYWYSITLLIAFTIGGILAIKEGKKSHVPTSTMIDYFFYLIFFSLIGARLYYVIFNFSYYQNDLISIFKVWEGGLAIHGGIIAGFIVTYIYASKQGIYILKMTDIMSVSLILGQAIGRWGNFFNQEAYGPVISLENLQNLHIPQFIIDGMNINGTYYQPTFLYESIWCLIGFIILVLIRKFKKTKIGEITSYYLVWYGIGRFMIESLRQDSLMFLNFKMAQIVSIIMIIMGIILFNISLKKDIDY